jgi:hypothetical protein
VSIWTRLRDEPDWPFVDGVPDQGVFTTKQIMARELPITGIVHDRDGDWQFLDGDSATPEEAAVPDGEAALVAPVMIRCCRGAAQGTMTTGQRPRRASRVAMEPTKR